MSTDDDDEGHDRLVIDDPMDDVASTQSTPRKATINSVNSNAPEDVDMEEGELIDSAETILQSPVSSKTKEKRQIAGTSTLLDGDSVKSASSSSGISAKEKSAIGFKAPNDTDNGHHHSDQKSADSMQPVKPIWKKSVSPSCDSVYNKKSAGTAEASSSTSNSTNTKRSLKQDLDASADEVVGGKPTKAEKAALKHSNLNTGVKNFLTPQPPASKKKKVQMVDKSTCVLTKACQLEDALLSLKPGSTACLNITIVCKAGANTLYILAKWKGKEYHGVLTDGEPVHSHLYAQKRADKNSDHTTPNSAAGGGHSDKTGVSSTGKVRGKRGANRQVAGATDKKNRHADDATENNYASGDPNSSLNCKSQEEGGSLPSTAKSSTSKQYELASDKSFVRRCPHKQCGYRFESMSEVNTHLVMGHADTRATMCEAIATQTDPIETTCMGVQTCEPEPQERLCSKCKQSTSTDQDDSSKMCPSSNTAVQKITEEKSLQDLFKVVRSNCEKKLGGESGTKSSTSPDAFSDISDDGAPMLEKEENFESNKTGADKKTAVNEPIEIIPPTENTGPTLDILSPVLSSSVATSKQDGANQKQQDLPTTTSAAASSSIPLASPLTGKRPPGSSVAQPICNLSPSPSNKPSLVQPENVQQPLNSHQPTPQQSSSSHPTGMSLPLAPPNPAPPHIFMNQMPMNPFQAASFLNPAAFYSHPQLAQFAAAAAASGQMPGSSSQANSRLVSPHQLPPSPFAVNGGGMAGPLGVPSSSGASGCLSTGKPDANSQLQRQHKIYELKQLQQQQTQPSTSTLGLPCTSSGEGGRTSATGLLGAGESPATLRSSSAVPMAAGSPSVIAARPPPFGGHRGMPGVPSPGTSMTGGASLPTQMQLQLAGLHAQQPSVSQQQQPGLSPAQMHHYQMQMQRLSQNFQAFSRNQNEMPNMIGGGLPAGGMDTATYAALFGGGNNSQLFQQQQSTAGNSSGAPGINQQNLLQPPK